MRVLELDIKNKTDFIEHCKKINVSSKGIRILSAKSKIYYIKIYGIKVPAGLVIKQEILSIGGDACLPKDAIINSESEKRMDILVTGTESQLLILSKKLRKQPFGLGKISNSLKELIKERNSKKVWKFKKSKLNCSDKVSIMGIINVTPDSFYDGGKYDTVEKAVNKALEHEENGADIIDIGAESSRPGAKTIKAEEEIARLKPVLKKLKKKLKIPVSIDTSKYKVAEICLKMGADIINDITGLKKSPEIAGLVSKYNAGLVIMHMKGTPKTMQKKPEYKDIISEIYTFLKKQIKFAMTHGVKKENIVVDPGIGFGKTLEHNLKIIKNLGTFRSLGCPLLIGPSNKSFIGSILGVEPEDRVEGTLSSVLTSIFNGASIIRVHNVLENYRAVKIYSSIAGV